MKKILLPLISLVSVTSLSAAHGIPSDAKPSVIVSTGAEPVAAGKFAPTWESLRQYQVPEWFRDAKFGIWARICRPPPVRPRC